MYKYMFFYDSQKLNVQLCKNSNASDCIVLFSIHTFYIQSILISTHYVSYKMAIPFNKGRLEKSDMFRVFRGIEEH